ncbi:MAG: hypothetical protein KJ792_08350 [Actinobacteria bacterium]|nr:hypothetical protein [Actinomycetota bacterium]MCG2800671.1 DUF5719 family protein [Cellulomonas sp.]
MSDRTPQRRWLGRLGRAGTALAVLAVTVAVVGAGIRQPSATAHGVPDPTAHVPASATTLVCPGTVQLPEGARSTGSEFDAVPVTPRTSTETVTVGSDAGAALVRRLDGTAAGALAAGGASLRLNDVATATVVRADAGSSGATQVAAASMTVTTAGDLRGLSGASCQPASAQSWLVGGATSVGATARLVLVNPGSTAAEVTWQVWGAAGPVDLTNDRALVAPGAQQVVDLAAVAGEQRALVVQVSVSGGQVSAHLQDDLLNGFTAAGTDLVVPGSGPAARQIVPGLVVGSSAVGDSSQPVLRLLSPDMDTTARISLLGSGGPVELPGADSVDLSAGQVVDVPLGGLPADRYTVVVDADAPFVASAAFSRVGAAGELDDTARVDRALAASTPVGDGLVAVPVGTASTLVIGAVGDGAQVATDVSAAGQVEVIGTDGRVLVTHQLSVDAGTTGAWSIDDLAPAGSGSKVAAVRLVTSSGSGASLAWALVSTLTQADGELVSLLDPVRVDGAAAMVPVRQDPALGLG